jgi:hypothetical protein
LVEVTTIEELRDIGKSMSFSFTKAKIDPGGCSQSKITSIEIAGGADNRDSSLNPLRLCVPERPHFRESNILETGRGNDIKRQLHT